MSTPGAESPFWQTIIAGLGLSSVTIGAAWRLGRAPFKRLERVEKALHDVEARQLDMLKDSDMYGESIKNLHTEHGKLREMLAAQPTRDDLRRSDDKVAAQISAVKDDLSKQMNMVVDLLTGRHH